MQVSTQPPRTPQLAFEAIIASPIRIMIANGYRLFGEALSELLTAVPGFAVVGHASDGESAFWLAKQTLPAIVLLDLDTTGEPEDIMRQLLKVAPAPRVVILSVNPNPGFARQMLSLGAHGYLHKAISGHDLALAIHQIADSRRTVTLVDSPRMSAVASADLLTDRERQVLALVARALSNRQIATKLNITEGTVKRHLCNVFGKLGAVSRLDAVNKAGISLAESSDVRQLAASTRRIA